MDQVKVAMSKINKAVKNNYFVYIGNKNVRKAGIYVKELCCNGMAKRIKVPKKL